MLVYCSCTYLYINIFLNMKYVAMGNKLFIYLFIFYLLRNSVTLFQLLNFGNI